MSDQKCNDPVCHVERLTGHNREHQVDINDICVIASQKGQR